MITRFIVIWAIWLFVDLYVYQALKTVLSGQQNQLSTIITWAYWIIDLTLMAIILSLAFSGKFAHGPNKNFGWLTGAMFVVLVPKLVVIPFLLVEDIVRVLQGSYSAMFGSKLSGFFPERRKFVSQVGLGLASIPFFGMIYGIVKGKYAYRVHKVTLKFKDLPKAFDGFTITQLSDIHSGSFDNEEAVQHGIDMANEQKSDLLVFTGDLVNNRADEMLPWIKHFKQLKAPFGKYSILGNHDYGDYVEWDNPKDKVQNLEDLKVVHQQIGFNLMLNEHTYIEKNGERIALIGVENWGTKGFVKHGDLDQATAGIDSTAFKVLLSHDPSHWEAITLGHREHIHLTLSGHTHGMQFGIEIPGFKWSPSKYIYKQWAGAYEQFGKYIYVNRGFGFLGFPGRVGILPEITVIKLERA